MGSAVGPLSGWMGKMPNGSKPMLSDWQAAAINRPNQNQLAAKDHARFEPEGTGCSRLEASTFLRDSKLAPGGRPTLRPTDFHCHSGNRLGGASGVLSEPRLFLRLITRGSSCVYWAGSQGRTLRLELAVQQPEASGPRTAAASARAGARGPAAAQDEQDPDPQNRERSGWGSIASLP